MCLFHLDLLNIIMIGLAKELPEHDETYELHRLLGALLSRGLITKMYKNGLSIELIASATDKTIEEVKTIIEGKEKSQEA